MPFMLLLLPLLLSLLLLAGGGGERGSFAFASSLSTSSSSSLLSTSSSEDTTCYLTGRPSSAPTSVPLSFCTMHGGSGGACCDPASDAQIGDYYSALVEVSDPCAAHQTQAHLRLKQLFCFGCSPRQPTYTDLLAPNGTSSSATVGIVYLCPDVPADADPAAFDSCGLLRPQTRGDMCAGDDYILPSLYYGDGEAAMTSTAGRGLAFIEDVSAGRMPYFEAFEVRVCNDTDAACLARCFSLTGTGVGSTRTRIRGAATIAATAVALIWVTLSLLML